MRANFPIKTISIFLLTILIGLCCWQQHSNANRSISLFTTIHPTFTVVPNLVFSGQQSSIYITILNETPSLMELQPRDTFNVSIDPQYLTISSVEMPIAVNSEILTSSDFQAF